MTALIFPGVLSAVPGAWYIGAAGALAALLLSVSRKIPSVLAVIGAVLTVLILNYSRYNIERNDFLIRPVFFSVRTLIVSAC
jgi:hypothetical protein